ncbi:hypothetical protein AB0873_09255 [Micromonospora sp. NPDC047707]|uniref:hypothetical protein n=1 Tax=Micromonospora sp. NPDC047707 TaxID=3154498 RepID=UPI0034572C07
MEQVTDSEAKAGGEGFAGEVQPFGAGLVDAPDGLVCPCPREVGLAAGEEIAVQRAEQQ